MTKKLLWGQANRTCFKFVLCNLPEIFHLERQGKLFMRGFSVGFLLQDCPHRGATGSCCPPGAERWRSWEHWELAGGTLLQNCSDQVARGNHWARPQYSAGARAGAVGAEEPGIGGSHVCCRNLPREHTRARKQNSFLEASILLQH